LYCFHGNVKENAFPKNWPPSCQNFIYIFLFCGRTFGQLATLALAGAADQETPKHHSKKTLRVSDIIGNKYSNIATIYNAFEHCKWQSIENFFYT
jgi:hypothetical protein